MLFTEQTAWYEHVDGTPWSSDDDDRVCSGAGGLLFNDDVYAVVFDNEPDAVAYAERHDGLTRDVDGNDVLVYSTRYYPNQLVVCDTVDDVYNACSGCCDEPTWETTAP